MNEYQEIAQVCLERMRANMAELLAIAERAPDDATTDPETGRRFLRHLVPDAQRISDAVVAWGKAVMQALAEGEVQR